MGEFFKDWRRKAGLVTLAMVCAFSSGWLRSYVATDEAWMALGEFVMLSIRSMDRRVVFQSGNTNARPWELHFRTSESSKIEDLRMGDVEWRMEWNGFAVGEHELMDTHYWTIPCWSLALPLTLLSVWLILIKPRKVKPATGSAP